MPEASCYLRQLAACVVAVVLLIVGFMVLVDPYRAFDAPAIDGFNAIKPRGSQQNTLSKSRILARWQARTVLLGNSRVEVGLDPQSTLWPAALRPVVNAAQAGTGPDAQLCRLREAIAAGKPDLVVLGIDFTDFLAANRPAEAAEASRDATCDNSALLWRSLFSINGIIDAVLTVVEQDRLTGATVDADGFSPGRHYLTHVSRIGYAGLFQQKLAEDRRKLANKSAPDAARAASQARLEELRAILRLARAEGITLVLYVHPFHETYLDLLRELGLWDGFEAWKQQVQAMVEAVNRAATGNGTLRLIELGGSDEPTLEPVSAKGDVHMRWYWEAGHYKSALGDRIIDAVLMAACLPPGSLPARDVCTTR